MNEGISVERWRKSKMSNGQELIICKGQELIIWYMWVMRVQNEDWIWGQPYFCWVCKVYFQNAQKRAPKQSTETGPYPKQPRTFFFFFFFLIMTKTVKTSIDLINILLHYLITKCRCRRTMLPQCHLGHKPDQLLFYEAINKERDFMSISYISNLYIFSVFFSWLPHFFMRLVVCSTCSTYI